MALGYVGQTQPRPMFEHDPRAKREAYTSEAPMSKRRKRRLKGRKK